MRIVIDIPDSEYLLIKNSELTSFVDFSSKECMMHAIRNGIPYEERLTGEWIRVSERLPKIDTENGWKASDVVLVCLADGKIHMGFYCEDKKWRFCSVRVEKKKSRFGKKLLNGNHYQKHKGGIV